MDVTVYGGTIVILARLGQRSFGSDLPFFAKAASPLIAIVAIAMFLPSRSRAWAKHWLVVIALLTPLTAGIFLYNVWRYQTWIGQHHSTIDAPPIILFVFDELAISSLLDKRGDIDSDIYPNFKFLSVNGIWFKNTITNHPYTDYSFPSFLSGIENAGRTKNFENFPYDTIPSILRNNGYVNDISSPVFSCIESFSPCTTREDANIKLGIKNSLNITYYVIDHIIPSFIITRYFPRIVNNVTPSFDGRIENFLPSVKKGNFYLFHSMASHGPPLINHDGTVHPLAFTPPTARTVTDALHPASGAFWRAYREQMRFVDAELGRFIAALKASGAWDNAIIAVTADHGLCVSERCNRGSPEAILEPEGRLAWVPFFLRAPGLTPRVDDRPAQLIDLAPTLLSAAHRSDLIPKAAEGLDLLTATIPPDRIRRLTVNEDSGKTRIFALPASLPLNDLGIPQPATGDEK